ALLAHAATQAMEAIRLTGVRAKADAARQAQAKGADVAAVQSQTGHVGTEDVDALFDFILDRLRGYYADKSVPVQHFNAVAARFAAGADGPVAAGAAPAGTASLVDFDRRIAAIGGFATLPEAEALAAANKRIGNILRKAEGEIPAAEDRALLREPAEIALADAVEAACSGTDASLARGDYAAVLARLAQLRPQVDAFFDAVMVNADDEALRRNRLALLQRLSARLGSVAAIQHLSASTRVPAASAKASRHRQPERRTNSASEPGPAGPGRGKQDMDILRARRGRVSTDGSRGTAARPCERPAHCAGPGRVADPTERRAPPGRKGAASCRSTAPEARQRGPKTLRRDEPATGRRPRSVKRPSTPLRYPAPMRIPRRIAATAVLFLLSLGTAHAVTVGEVAIIGLDEEMERNVRVSLSLVDAAGQEVTGRRMGYLVRMAETEAREALEPFGLYSPTIEVERSRANGPMSVTVRVDPGEPVRVRNSNIAIIGEGGQDRYLQADIDAFIPSPGAIFNHADYEASKI